MTILKKIGLSKRYGKAIYAIDNCRPEDRKTLRKARRRNLPARRKRLIHKLVQMLNCRIFNCKDVENVINADFSREVCLCNNNFHIFAATCSPRFPSEQRA